MSLNFLEEIPPELLTKSAEQLHDYLGGPTVITVKGELDRKVIISILLHGNETSGWEVVKNFLQVNQKPKFTTVILIGNTKAAKENLRYLKNDDDYNRIWNINDSKFNDNELAKTFYERYINDDIEVVIDIHNNNGYNPCFAMCLADPKYQNAYDFAAKFNQRVVSMVLELGSFMEGFGRKHPAVTIECGLPGSIEGINLASNYINKVVNQAEIILAEKIEHYFLNSRLQINPQLKIGFGDEQKDITFPKDIAKNWNFQTLPKGSSFAKLSKNIASPILEFDAKGREVTSNKFIIENNEIIVNEDLKLAMLVEDYQIIKQDCLCYTLVDFDSAR